ncbi:MAG: glycoside hydrolase family 26 protein [Bacteroidia bacterium]
MKYFILALAFFSVQKVSAQLKFVVEDFEGFANNPGDLKSNGVFVFGNTKAMIDEKQVAKKGYSGDRAIRLTQNAAPDFGGWGKGIGMNVELNASGDYLNFYVFQPSSNGMGSFKVELQEDDSGDGIYEANADDTWEYPVKPSKSDQWELVSIPLADMKDENTGGDGIFNIGYKTGKLLCFIVTFPSPQKSKKENYWLFDFICFSKGKLRSGNEIFDIPVTKSDACSLGAWSKEGNAADFVEIASGFENNFRNLSEKKIGVVHFFQPFAVDGGSYQNFYPSVDRINKVIQGGYIPMITLEDHFPNAKPNFRQPNLYSIVEGHFDVFFADWARQIKEVKGIVMLRILHEFNGNWYPWCISKNDNNPELLIKAYRHIHDIFRDQQVDNVRFIWCPNSTSFPQESWNYIVDAYPGDQYVDYVGLDIYNGAGNENSVWRSFRKEGIENYFTLTQLLPGKPLFVCETASRERRGDESQTAQSKPEWIRDMSVALCTDMSQICLLSWFNEKESFKVNSSPAAQKAFLNYVMKNEHFSSGPALLSKLLKP